MDFIDYVLQLLVMLANASGSIDTITVRDKKNVLYLISIHTVVLFPPWYTRDQGGIL